MKKIAFAIGTYILVLSALFVWAASIEAHYSKSLGGPTVMAANSTNSTVGTAYMFPLDETPISMRLFGAGRGVSAATGGTNMWFVQVCDENANWTTASLSYYRLGMSSLSTTTNWVDDVYNIAGARGVRFGRAENSFSQAISNMTLQAEFTVRK